VTNLLAKNQLFNNTFRDFMRIKSLFIVSYASFQLSNTENSEDTLNASMKSLNNINASFVKSILALREV
jgi:hypothetical protein